MLRKIINSALGRVDNPASIIIAGVKYHCGDYISSHEDGSDVVFICNYKKGCDDVSLKETLTAIIGEEVTLHHASEDVSGVLVSFDFEFDESAYVFESSSECAELKIRMKK